MMTGWTGRWSTGWPAIRARTLSSERMDCLQSELGSDLQNQMIESNLIAKTHGAHRAEARSAASIDQIHDGIVKPVLGAGEVAKIGGRNVVVYVAWIQVVGDVIDGD